MENQNFFTNTVRILVCIVLGIALVNSIDPNNISFWWVIILVACWVVVYNWFQEEQFLVKLITFSIVSSAAGFIMLSGAYQGLAYWYQTSAGNIGSIFVQCPDERVEEIEYSARDADNLLRATALYSCELVLDTLEVGYSLKSEFVNGIEVVYPVREEKPTFVFRINKYWKIPLSATVDN